MAQSQDSYPWTNCNAFESTKKNCPRGEACLKLKSYQSYAWNWAMRCKFLSARYVIRVLVSVGIQKFCLKIVKIVKIKVVEIESC